MNTEQKYEDYIANIANSILADTPDAEFAQIISAITGENPRAYEYSIRMSPNPLSEVGEVYTVAVDVITALSTDEATAEATDMGLLFEQLADWYDYTKNSIQIRDSSLVDPLRLDAINEDDYDRYEFDPTSRIVFGPTNKNYDPGYDPRDAWGKGNTPDRNPVFVASANPNNKTSRDIWKRVSKDAPREVFILCDYGNFSLDRTKKYHDSLFKTRTTVRRIQQEYVPFYMIGAVGVNMRNGVVECFAGKCDFKKQLTYEPPLVISGFEGTVNFTFDEQREWMEYQVLKILEHLSTHNSHGIYPVFPEGIKRFRDDATNKLLSRSIILNKSINN